MDTQLTINDNEGDLVSLARARKILGSLASDLNDDQVRDLLYSLHLLAREQLRYVGSKDKVLINAVHEPNDTL